MKPTSIDDKPPSYRETMKLYSNQIDELSLADHQYDVLSEHASDLDELETETIDETEIKNEIMLQKQLDQNYPVKYVLVDSVVMAILNVILISLQIVAIKNDAAISYIGSAIWAGVYNLITVLMAVFTIKYRNSIFVTITTTMKLFGMIVSFGGFIVVQILAFSHYNCIAASYYRPCYNKDMKPIHLAIIIIGIPCLCSNLAFFLYFQIKVFGRFGHRFRATF